MGTEQPERLSGGHAEANRPETGASQRLAGCAEPTVLTVASDDDHSAVSRVVWGGTALLPSGLVLPGIGTRCDGGELRPTDRTAVGDGIVF